MEKNNRQIIYAVLLFLLLIVMLGLLYMGAMGMNRGITATKLSENNGYTA